MAFYGRKNGKVYVYYRQGGKQTQLKRHLTCHLDGAEPHQIEAFVSNIGYKYEKLRLVPESGLYSDDRLSLLVEDFKKTRLAEGYALDTVRYQCNLLLDWGIPFFLSQKEPLKDPNQWPGVTNKLREYLRQRMIPPNAVRKLRTALLKFWQFLKEEGIIHTNQPLILYRCKENQKETPLKNVLQPSDVLSWAKKVDVPVEVKLMGLLGYFFSLRPQETFAVRKKDFDLGEDALKHECSKVMKELLNLKKFMALLVHQQRRADGSFLKPKAHSKGWVCCFNEKASEMIVSLLKDASWEELLIASYKPNWQYSRWNKHGIEGITLKDLRRSSLYYLGQHTKMGERVLTLKLHARHSRLETTELYCRRPTEEGNSSGNKKWTLTG